MKKSRKFIINKSKRFLERFPKLFIMIALYYNRIKGRQTERIVSRSSTICVEGFPRCSNSFVAAAFRQCSKEPICMATHLHSSAQVIQATKLGIPTLVLIRKPEGCIISLRALSLEIADNKNKEPTLLPIAEDLKWYISFYHDLLPYSDKFVIAEFQDITKNINHVIGLFNQKYRTFYNSSLSHKEIEDKIFNSGGYHLSPSIKRNAFKVHVKEEFFHPRNARLVEEANRIYQIFINSQKNIPVKGLIQP